MTHGLVKSSSGPEKHASVYDSEKLKIVRVSYSKIKDDV